ncbi:hypothetical protein GCM10009080_00350 [Cupriavidus pauculus]
MVRRAGGTPPRPVVARDTLTVKAESIDLSPNVVSIGTNAYKAQGGWNVVTGTVVQPGGFLSAMHMDIEADSIRAINDAFRVTRADGTVDADASAALVAQLKESLGLNYTEGTVADDIHTQFIKEKKGLGVLGQILAIAASVAISIATAGTGSMFAPLISGVLSSMVGQVLTTGTLNMAAALKAGVVSMVTAGLTQGALDGLSLGDGGLGTLGTNISTGSWTAVQDSLGKVIAASVVRSAINAGVNTIAYGGSFGQAFANGLIRDAAAVAANAVGIRAPGIGVPGSDPQSILANVLGHALVGCAAQSLSGGDCAGGAIGGAASAIAAPLIRDSLYAGSQTVFDNGDGTQTIRYGNIGYNATTVALATLIGGSAGALLGTNATAAALAAQNEALNNSLSVKIVPRPVPTPFGVVMVPMPVVTDDPIGTPNNGPQKSDPLTNPLEEQNSKGNAVATPNNGPQGSTLTSTPASGPQGPTILGNPGCMLALAICAGLTAIAQIQNGASPGTGSDSNSQPGLDWSIVSKTGESRPDHIVAQHGDLNLNKPNQGVFYGDPVSTVNDAWNIVRQAGIQPVTSGSTDIYVVPRQNSGYAGGYTGQRQNLDTVTIITVHGTNQIITAFPGNGLPLPKSQ